MGLIDLQTDLKSLTYGSQQPYVTEDIKDPQVNSGVLNQADSRLDDLTRISKLLKDTPGVKFAANQAFLKQQGFSDKIQKRKTQDKNSTGGAVLREAGETAKQVAGVVGSTLAQVPVNGTGTHFVQGLIPNTYLKQPGSEDRSQFAQFFGAGSIQGAPLSLRGEKVSTSNIDSNFPTGNIQGVGNYRDRYTSGSSYVSSSLNLNLDTQDTTLRASDGTEIIPTNNGTPTNREQKSALKERGTGLGYDEPNKELPQDDQSNSITNYSNLAKDGTPILLANQRGLPPVHGEIQDTTAETGSLNSRPNTDNGVYIPRVNKSTVKDGSVGIQDFRSESAISGSSKNTYSFNYNSRDINKEQRVGLGNQGKKIEIDPKLKYTKTDPEAIDSVNKLGVLNGKPSLEDSRDLISLNFQILTPETTKYLYFRAYLDSFSDDYSAAWGSTKYLGRAENMYTYEGFERSVSIGFKVAASTREEMKPIYQKINYLASSTAPTYGQGTFMRGTLAKVTVGDYIFQVPAVINSVKYSWETNYPWEISMSNPESDIDDDMQVLPHVLDCSVDLSIIHDFIPQTGNVPFISNPFGNSFGKQVWTGFPSQVEGQQPTDSSTVDTEAVLPPPVDSSLAGSPAVGPQL